MKRILLAAVVAASAAAPAVPATAAPAAVAPAAVAPAPAVTVTPVPAAAAPAVAVPAPVVVPERHPGPQAGPRTEWPELVGLPKEQAGRAVLAERPELEVVYVPEGAAVTMDYRESRVRIVHDRDGIVTRTPRIG
ncbi:serine protease inhibitor, partial [Kitasatospora sp. NPDC054939]